MCDRENVTNVRQRLCMWMTKLTHPNKWWHCISKAKKAINIEHYKDMRRRLFAIEYTITINCEYEWPFSYTTFYFCWDTFAGSCESEKKRWWRVIFFRLLLAIRFHFGAVFFFSYINGKFIGNHVEHSVPDYIEQCQVRWACSLFALFEQVDIHVHFT